MTTACNFPDHAHEAEAGNTIDKRVANTQETNKDSDVGHRSCDAAASEDITTPLQPTTTGLRLVLTIFGLGLAVFCVALDNSIVATAIPKITDEFHSLQDVGWYGSAYLLTTCAFQLFFGKLYFAFDVKSVFILAVLLFELGSLIAGVAPSSIVLILGRVVAGIGAAGVFSGALIIITKVTVLEKRAAYQSSLGGIYGIASVVGPLLGGAFTDKITWRWCFYINLPFGCFTVATAILALRLPNEAALKDLGLKKALWQLDPFGTFLFITSITCILLALQWGGTTYAWGDGRVVTLLVVFALGLAAFIAVQAHMGDYATVPARIGLQRTIAFGSIFAFLLGGSFFLLLYFLPIWFQAVKGVSALDSSIDSIPLILANTIGILVSGAFVTRFGWYIPPIYVGVLLTSVGSGLLTTLKADSSTRDWIGYQITYGIGCGFAFQLPQIAAQAVLPSQDVPIGVTITLFTTIFGGSLFVSIADNVLDTAFTRNIVKLGIPGVDATLVTQIGATQLRNMIPTAYLGPAIEAYNEAVVDTFRVALVISCASALGAAGMQWKNLKLGPSAGRESA